MLGHFFPLRKAARIGRVQLTAGLTTAVLCGGLLTQVAVAADTSLPGTTNWQGLGWGIGIGTDFDIGGKRIISVTTPNNIVRAGDTSSNVGISFVLEAHYFFAEWPPNLMHCLGYNCNDVATGPFVAIEVGTGASSTADPNGLITAFALGWMVGLHHPKLDPNSHQPDPNDHSSWNFGVGFRVDPKAQVLGDGLVLNQPLPAGDTVRYKYEPRYGVMLMSSFSF
jgi:hypothetical protein